MIKTNENEKIRLMDKLKQEIFDLANIYDNGIYRDADGILYEIREKQLLLKKIYNKRN